LILRDAAGRELRVVAGDVTLIDGYRTDRPAYRSAADS
jgi:hypothetical protein